MSLSNPNTLLIIAGVVAIIVEILIGAATGFELFVLGVIFIIGGVVGMVTGSLQVGIASVVGMILIYIIFGRRFIRQSLHITTKKTNVESIIGETAMVVEPITPDRPGRVKIEGEQWRAESNRTIEKGKQAMIVSVSGVTLNVKEV